MMRGGEEREYERKKLEEDKRQVVCKCKWIKKREKKRHTKEKSAFRARFFRVLSSLLLKYIKRAIIIIIMLSSATTMSLSTSVAHATRVMSSSSTSSSSSLSSSSSSSISSPSASSFLCATPSSYSYSSSSRIRATRRRRSNSVVVIGNIARRNRVILGASSSTEGGGGGGGPGEEEEGAVATKSSDQLLQGEASETTALPENFCIIEGANTILDFSKLQVDDIQQNLESRRQKVFLLMEEMRRLRVQLRIKSTGSAYEEENMVQKSEFQSVVPGFPVLTEDSISDYRIYWGATVLFFLLFGGLFAPIAEVKLGVGGTTYADFIEFVHFPKQLAEVDPIVASFTGGAVGVVSAFFAIEIRSAQEQRKKVCMYCKGSGYLTCAECATPNTYKPGRLIDPNTGSKCVCNNCLGTTKVMCTTCLCTGMALVTEHDPRIDPFD